MALGTGGTDGPTLGQPAVRGVIKAKPPHAGGGFCGRFRIRDPMAKIIGVLNTTFHTVKGGFTK